MNDILPQTDKELIVNSLKNYTEEVFTCSFNNIKKTEDAISFSYGWLLLAYGTEYTLVEEKLSKLNDQMSYANQNIKFIITPILNIARILNAEEEILKHIGLELNNMNNKLDNIKKFLFDFFNNFLMNIYKIRAQIDEVSEEEQKSFLFNSLKFFQAPII